MDKVQKQRSNIVLYREKKDGEHYIRIEYAGDPAIALLLAQDTDVEKTDNGSAYMTAAAFKLPDFYDRYSPHAYIDYSRCTYGIPNHSGHTYCRKAIWNCWNRSGTVPRP